jgi:hypothetical protein
MYKLLIGFLLGILTYKLFLGLVWSIITLTYIFLEIVVISLLCLGIVYYIIHKDGHAHGRRKKSDL